MHIYITQQNAHAVFSIALKIWCATTPLPSGCCVSSSLRKTVIL